MSSRSKVALQGLARSIDPGLSAHRQHQRESEADPGRSSSDTNSGIPWVAVHRSLQGAMAILERETKG